MVKTSRGCGMNRMYGRTFRTYKFARVVDDLTNARKYGAKYIAFADDKIPLNVKRFESLCDAIVVSWHKTCIILCRQARMVLQLLQY